MKSILTNWRTTLAGLALIASAVARIHSTNDLSDTSIAGSILTGLGLLLAHDAKPPIAPAS